MCIRIDYLFLSFLSTSNPLLYRKFFHPKYPHHWLIRSPHHLWLAFIFLPYVSLVRSWSAPRQLLYQPAFCFLRIFDRQPWGPTDLVSYFPCKRLPRCFFSAWSDISYYIHFSLSSLLALEHLHSCHCTFWSCAYHFWKKFKKFYTDY